MAVHNTNVCPLALLFFHILSVDSSSVRKGHTYEQVKHLDTGNHAWFIPMVALASSFQTFSV